MVSTVEERHSGLKQSLICILEEIYSEHDNSILNCLADNLADVAIAKRSSTRCTDLPLWSESDVLLIAYPDNIVSDSAPPIQSLQEFLVGHLSETISIVHVLPFFPSTGDDGFSVQDYFEVDERFGDWADINRLAENANLMADVVLNHCSVQSEWFKGFKNGDPDFERFFCIVPDEFDLSNIVRPRSSSLIEKFLIDGEEKNIWCTFSSDQVDLNFKNPKVLKN